MMHVSPKTNDSKLKKKFISDKIYRFISLIFSFQHNVIKMYLDVKHVKDHFTENHSKNVLKIQAYKL